MEDLSLSPTPQVEEEDDANYDLASASKLIPLSMTDSASGERPLPSLHSPLMFRDVPFVGLFVVHLILMMLTTGGIRTNGEREELEEERREVVGGLKDLDDHSSVGQDDADVGVALPVSICRFVQGSCIFSMAGLSALAVMLLLLESSNGMFWGIVCTGVVVMDLVWYTRSNHGLDFRGSFLRFVLAHCCVHWHILCGMLCAGLVETSRFSRDDFMALRSERVEHFIRTYHKYSFVHIAGYNKPYYVAAHDAWKLIEHHGVEAIVDDDLTSRILLLGGNGWAGVMSALTASALAATQVIAAVIKTLFVCFAENPGRLSQLHRSSTHRFVRLAELKSFRDHKAPASTRE
ncbi:hypothetical protein PInf_013723 [Phytophthora infestans]|nr:hypothetical protein PInf_013723 [Phytophthora infestans]